MLDEFIAEEHVTLNAIIGLYPANAVGDDIEVYTDESRAEVRGTLFGMRQQTEKDSKTDPCAPVKCRVCWGVQNAASGATLVLASTPITSTSSNGSHTGHHVALDNETFMGRF